MDHLIGSSLSTAALEGEQPDDQVPLWQPACLRNLSVWGTPASTEGCYSHRGRHAPMRTTSLYDQFDC